MIATVTVDPVRNGEDVFLLLDADQLAVAGALELVCAVQVQRGCSLEAANTDLCSRGQCDGGCGDVRGMSRLGGGVFALGGGGQQQRGRGDRGCEVDEDHGCGDGGLVDGV